MNALSSARPAPVALVRDAATHVAARIAAGGATLFVGLLVVLHVVKPEYEPSWRMVSEYAIGRHGWIMQLAFYSLAASCAAACLVVRRSVQTTGGRIGIVLLAATAAALLAAGVFVSDPITATKEQLTRHGNFHGLSAMVGIPGLPLAGILITRSLVRDARWTGARRSLRVTAHLMWITLLGMIVTIALTLPAAGGKFGPTVPAGWPNRLLVLAYAAWLIVVARQGGRVSRAS
ncbi:MAG TPA: DUF998 domain-containing protein [Gemmatimonadaceae bacterium]|nr:DUF998 domain-containing protein [Gemmatimonadaceae bacterium]